MSSVTPCSLYEYDLILTTNQSAINAQFENLFDTPDPDDFTEYLIPHSMKLGYISYDSNTGEWKDSDEGLTVDEIECPTVDINSVEPDDGENRAVCMSLKIVTGTMSYCDDNGNTQDVTVDGWTFSWVAGLGALVIPDLDKAKCMHPNAKIALAQALQQVPDEDFLPAAIYCTFESTKVAKTFKLYTENGTDVSSSDNASRFLKYFTTTYSHTDHLPWVLGYYVTQEIPHPDNTPPTFWPIKYWYSTTAYPTDADYATLNYCMITSDPHDDNLVDPGNNPEAGILTTPFIDVTRADNLTSDGILGISNATFYSHWLKPMILDQIRYKYGANAVTSRNDSGSTGRCSCRKWDDFDTGWHSYTKRPKKRRGKWPSDDEIVTTKTRRTGWLSASLTYLSALQNISSGTIPVDTKRMLTVKVTGTAIVHTDGKTSFDFGDWQDWQEDETKDISFSFTISAGSGGSWVITWVGGTYYTCGASDVIPDISSSRVIPSSHVMPNGDVFTFTGLDCDANGNIYSHVKYRTIDSGTTSGTN